MPAAHALRRPRAGGLLGKPQDHFRLRAIGPDGDVRTLRIKSRKYSIGADPSCSLRLHGFDLHPVHCLIVRGARGTVVRNLSPDNQLNGHEFRDAPLEKGDRLRLGPFEFVVLPPRRRRPSPAHFPSSTAQSETTAALQVTAAIESRMNRLEAQLIDLQRVQTRRKISKLRRTIEGLHDELERQRVDHLIEQRRWRDERDQLLEELAVRETEIPGSLQSYRPEVPASAPPGQQLEQQEQQLRQLTTQLDETRTNQQQQQADWSRQRTELEQQLSATTDQILELEAQLAAFEKESAGFAAERLTYEAKTTELTRSLRDLAAKLDQQQSAHGVERAEWQRSQAELQEQLTATQQVLEGTSLRLEEVERELAEQQETATAIRTEFERERDQLRQDRSRLENELAEKERAAEEAEARVKQWEQECTALAERAGELERHINLLQEATLDSHDISDSVEEAESLRKEMAAWRTQQEQRQQEWLAERQQLTEELDEARQHLQAEQSRQTQLEQQVAESRAEWQATEQELQAALAAASNAPSEQQTDQLRELEQKLSDLRSELQYWKEQAAREEPRAAVEDNRPSVGSQTLALPNSDPAVPESAVAESAVAESAVANSPDIVPSDIVPSDIDPTGTPTEQSSDQGPVNTAEVLARFGYTPEAAEEEFAATEENSCPEQGATELQANQRAEEAAEVPESLGEDDEGAIEDYMNRLLARVRGEQAVPVAPYTPPTPARTPITEATFETEEVEYSEEPAEEVADREYTPRRAAPEQSDRMAAMRSLANDSARSAIAKHAQQHWMEAAKYQICGMAVGVTGSIVSYVVLENRPTIAAVGVICGLLVAGLCAAQALVVRQALHSDSSPEDAEFVEEEGDEADDA